MSLKVNGKKIRGLRNKRGWTQEELGSKEMDAKGVKKISTRTIQKIENDQTFLCSKKMIKNLANVFDVDMNEILNNKTEVLLNNSLWDPVEKQSDVDKREFNNWIKPDEEKKLFLRMDFEMEENANLSEEQLNRIFTIDENMIGQSQDAFPDAGMEDIWDYNDRLREFKFIPISYSDLANGIGEKESSTIFHGLIKMEESAGQNHGDYLKLLPDSKENLSSNIKHFFESLSKANSYCIEPFIPKDESSTEIILKIIQNIEEYFKAEMAFSEEFMIKSKLVSLIEQLEENNIGLFFNMSISRSEQFDDVHGYMRCWEANYIKIIIKEWSSPSVLTKQLLHDSKNRISISTYKEGWRGWTEVDPILPDDQETVDLPF